MDKDMYMDEDMELNREQDARNDEVYNAVFDMCKVLTENENLEWDMYFIGEIADCAASILVRKGLRVHFPSVVTEEDGSQHIVEYYESEENEDLYTEEELRRRIEGDLNRVMAECFPSCHGEFPDFFLDEVIREVYEASSWQDSGVYADADISLAIQRTVLKNLTNYDL